MRNTKLVLMWAVLLGAAIAGGCATEPADEAAQAETAQVQGQGVPCLDPAQCASLPAATGIPNDSNLCSQCTTDAMWDEAREWGTCASLAAVVAAGGALTLSALPFPTKLKNFLSSNKLGVAFGLGSIVTLACKFIEEGKDPQCGCYVPFRTWQNGKEVVVPPSCTRRNPYSC